LAVKGIFLLYGFSQAMAMTSEVGSQSFTNSIRAELSVRMRDTAADLMSVNKQMQKLTEEPSPDQPRLQALLRKEKVLSLQMEQLRYSAESLQPVLEQVSSGKPSMWSFLWQASGSKETAISNERDLRQALDRATQEKQDLEKQLASLKSGA